MPITSSTQSSSLADILERVLDKGVVIAGDISIAIADIDLLRIRIRLVIASVDKAEQIGIDWWRSDPMFHSKAAATNALATGITAAQLEAENAALRDRLALMEQSLTNMQRILANQLTAPAENSPNPDESSS